MCGIVGYIGKRNTIPVLLDGLRKLEYRGYDSAGIAFFRDGRIEVRRSAGKIRDLEASIAGNDLRGFVGIGHTRWATHGRPTEENAHPHRAGGVVIVHNGIIENYLELKNKLRAEGHIFVSDTDTEVLCHLISSYTDKGLNLETATREALKDVKGAYALGIIREEEPDKIIAVKKDCPLVVGLGESEFFISSDIPAFLSYTRDVIILDNNELAVITPDGVFISKISGESVEKKVTNITWSPAMAEKGGYRHFMLKEIYEQPRAVADTLRGRFSIEDAEVNLDEFSMRTEDLQELDRVFFVACGTSWHAALIGKYMLEGIARMPSEVDIASEFRYREPILSDRSLVVVITQSGETADTIAAQREAKRLGAKVLSICNVVGSTSAREADYCFYTHSGPEIGVASTKAFVSQLVSLYLFAIAVSKAKGMFTKEMAKALLTELLELPEKVEKALALDDSVAKIAREFFKVKDFLYLGRGINYPVALEGALKLKEISYIHAEGYPAGEMKHGPIALIDDSLPVLVLAPRDKVYEKALSNIEEVRSRGGKIIAFATDGDTTVSSLASHTIFVPLVNQYLIPVLFTIPLQLLAYHIAVLRGCDVDQPRNLAKSVTVE
ncbi:MAG TPA: glutamine--fructose-6-phosphate transaminase (isomerizing) [Nitrospiraceae bacterium]|nr:glutamine--fructose-6-phosphate transaminase (isomerizing) [Nitrospiraceae bacterium]